MSDLIKTKPRGISGLMQDIELTQSLGDVQAGPLCKVYTNEYKGRGPSPARLALVRALTATAEQWASDLQSGGAAEPLQLSAEDRHSIAFGLRSAIANWEKLASDARKIGLAGGIPEQFDKQALEAATFATLFETAASASVTPAAPAETFAHSPDNCPSNHHNRGDDICSDCGEFLN